MSERPWVLGISSALHNGSVCLLNGEELVVAIQEERLTRRKRCKLDRSQPSLALEYCLATAGISLRDLAVVVDCSIMRDPVADAEEFVRSAAYLDGLPASTPVISISHHLGHAMAAFALSGFDESHVLVVDGAGSRAWQLDRAERAVAGRGRAHHSEHASLYHVRLGETPTPVEKHLGDTSYLGAKRGRKGMYPFATLGHMYSSAAKQTFGDYLEAGKVMGLAPYGRPTIPTDEFLRVDGNRFVFSRRVTKRFRHDDRWPARADEYADLAASTQRALEVGLAHLADRVASFDASLPLAYSGGVALNGIANHALFQPRFRQFFVPSASDDSGPAVGAAYYGLVALGVKSRLGKGDRCDNLGRSYSPAEVAGAIAAEPAVAEVSVEGDVLDHVAALLDDGKVVGWFWGGSEFGPRALGYRSILFDARRPDAREMLNSRVKFREGFRPYAPAVLAERVADWFDIDTATPVTAQMLAICGFRSSEQEARIPGASHVDSSARVQTIDRRHAPLLYDLIERFERRTGVPLVLNTSFNLAGEPIVETPADAIRTFLASGIDYLVLEGRLLTKDTNGRAEERARSGTVDGGAPVASNP